MSFDSVQTDYASMRLDPPGRTTSRQPRRQVTGWGTVPRVLVLAMVVGCLDALARDPGAESGPHVDTIEQARADEPRLVEECRQLTDEVKTLGELRDEYETLKAGGEAHMRAISLPGSGALVHDRIQELKRDIRQREANARDPELVRLKQEHNRLHDGYVAQMDARIAGDHSLARRSVGSYAALLERYAKARREWEPRQLRYPQATEEKERVCEQAREAQALVAAGACDSFNLGARNLPPRRPVAHSAGRGGGSNWLSGLLGIRAAHAIGTAPGEIAAYLRGALGLVCVKPRRSGSWTRLHLGQPVEVGDTVRTGRTGRARLEFTDRDEAANAGPSVMNLAPDSEMVIESFAITLEEGERERRRREGLISLIRGEIRAFMKGWGSSSSVNVRAGVAICGSRGTDFAVSHDPAQGRVTLRVAEGKVEFSTPRGRALVAAGQTASATGTALGPVSAMPAGLWERTLAAIEAPERPVSPAPTPASARPEASWEAQGWGCDRRRKECSTVLFEERYYETEHHRVSNAMNSPVDVYYYPVLDEGRPVFQDGAQLWNRFAQVLPGAPHAGYYHVTWQREGPRWVEREQQVAYFLPLFDAPHVQATPPPSQPSPPATPPAGPALPGRPFPPSP